MSLFDQDAAALWRNALVKKCLLLFAFLPSIAHADAGLQKRLAEPATAILESTKSPADLELCISDVIGDSYLPVPIRNGANRTDIFGFRGMMGAGRVLRTVSLIEERTGTRIEVRVRDGGSDDQLVSQIKGCLS